MIRLTAVAIALALLARSGTPAPTPLQTPGPLAGAASVDITPPPGFLTAGHGPESRITRGRWGSLRATAFFFRDRTGVPLLLITADLLAVTTAFHQEVARQLGLPLESVVIAATHTHHGPGNYFSSVLYNNLANRTRGFDPALRAFLLTRIVEAGRRAMDDAAAHRVFELDIKRGEMPYTMTRNRSPRVFMGDRARDVMLSTFGAGLPEDAAVCDGLRDTWEPEDYWRESGCPRLRSVDRHVTLLSLRRDGRLAAMAVFVSMHPTVLPAQTPITSPDLFGIARARLESNAGGATPIVGFFNGAEGDVHARRTARDASDVVKLGRALAAAVTEVSDRAAPRPLALDSIRARLHFAHAGEEVSGPDGATYALAREPRGGWPAIGGAEGDRTGYYDAVKKARRDAPSGEHGVKLVAPRLLAKASDYPQALPFSVIRLGELSLATVPFEMSTASGFELRRAMGLPRERLEIIGLANEYAAYTATEDEYQAQDYMGASTLWGPRQSGFIAATLYGLTTPGPPVTGTPGSDAHGSGKRTGPSLPKARVAPHHGLEALLAAAPDPGRLPTFTWCSAWPSVESYVAENVVVEADNGTVVDDDGVMVVIDRRPGNSNIAQWSAIWAGLLWDVPSPQRRFRFRVTRGNQVTVSEFFRPFVDSPASSCGN